MPAYDAPAASRRLPVAVIALLLTTLLMAIATGAVWFMVLRQTRQHDAVDRARTTALESSRDAARVLFSYDYRTLDKDFSAGKAVSTGAFLTQYSETTSKVVSAVAKEKKAVVKAEVVTAGVVRASESTVVVIVYVNQVTTSSLAAGPKVDLSRVRMTLVKVGDAWRVSKVEAL
jgi:Mce-associated membrane protein